MCLLDPKCTTVSIEGCTTWGASLDDFFSSCLIIPCGVLLSLDESVEVVKETESEFKPILNAYEEKEGIMIKTKKMAEIIDNFLGILNLSEIKIFTKLGKSFYSIKKKLTYFVFFTQNININFA